MAGKADKAAAAIKDGGQKTKAAAAPPLRARQRPRNVG